ncbi:MAG: bifunctional phosphoribosyl-AMP cyclohydrolase/phosphoribosyl-ATP diphosphatase HisIE [Bacteroidia bacterium]
MKIDFDKGDGLVPAIVQHAHTREVLMLGYMNPEALNHTHETGHVTFWSRSKGRLWTKGESSGHFLKLVSARIDCDGDTLLIMALPQGPTCHNGTSSCWGEGDATGFLHQLEAVIHDRRDNPQEKSYTASLLARGINKVAQKVGEEAVELVIEAKDNNRDLFLGEAADLMYHFLVLLAAKGVDLQEVEAVLQSRHGG